MTYTVVKEKENEMPQDSFVYDEAAIAAF